MREHKNNQVNQLLRVFAACRDGLIRSILKMCVRQEDVDDILQETFLRVLQANDKINIRSPEDYLFVVSRNLVLERLSSSSREINMEINDALAGVEVLTADHSVYYQRKFEHFNDALCSLPEKQRRAILLRKLYDLSHKEIARKMNVSVSSVEKYIAGGIKACRQKMNSIGYEFDEKNNISRKNPRSDLTNCAKKE